MNNAHRWPLHPAPVEGEALSAWLSRVANSYEMNLMDLLLYEWGKEHIADMDIRPPDGLLETIAGRSGIDLDSLRCMTISGWMPWLFDSFDLEDDAFNCYVNQFSVLLPQKNRPVRIVQGWRAWISRRNLNRACPLCFGESNNQPIFKLMWQFPLFVSCPVHSCWLEPFIGHFGSYYRWETEDLKPRQANKSIQIMDNRTEQAIVFGQVQLPRRTIHAGVWFRVLRTIIDELNTPLTYCGTHSKIIKKIWERSRHAVRAGQSYWRPYEIMDLTVQLQFLEAAAIAMHLIETGAIEVKGTHANFFLSIPETKIYQGDHQYNRCQISDEEDNLLKKLWVELEKLTESARNDPEAADALFHMLLLGRRDPKVVEEVRAILIAGGVPEDWCQIKKI